MFEINGLPSALFASRAEPQGAAAPPQARSEKESGFYVLNTGGDALKSRIALIRASQKHIDVQYYMLQDDLSGKVLMEELLQAADRGVKVRILLDALDFSRSREAARFLSCHEKIEFRIFNPATTTHHPFPLFSWKELRQLVVRYSKRMHNKLLLVDSVVGMVGGRNLGDEYFGVDVDFSFSDIDALVMGPVVKDMEKSFEAYWRSRPAFTLQDVGLKRPECEENVAYRIALRTFYELAESYGFFQPEKGEALLATLQSGAFPFHWGEAFFAADVPEKVLQETGNVQSPPVALLNHLLDKAEKEFIAVSPYVVPMEAGVRTLKSLQEKGVQVRILTNSLSATDIPAVHAAYSRYREELLRSGVELFELKRIPGKKSRSNFLRGRLSSRSSLHAKVYIIDRKWVVFGSMNLDPRSWLMNTENVVAVESPSLAQEMVELFKATSHMGASYHAVLRKGKVVFASEGKGGKIRYYRTEPKVGLLRRCIALLLSRLLPERQL